MSPNPKLQPGTPKVASRTAAEVVGGNPVTANGSDTFTVSINENHGYCVISASCTGPIPYATWVGLYDGPAFPGDPNSGYIDGAWFYLAQQTSLETSVPFGSNYVASVNILTNMTPTGNTYAYLVQTPAT